MLTVRFPDGTAIQYSSANYMVSVETCTDLYVRKDGPWVARILASSGAVIESIAACRVYNPTRSASLKELVDAVLSHRSPKWNESLELARLKAELHKFNAKSRCWRVA